MKGFPKDPNTLTFNPIEEKPSSIEVSRNAAKKQYSFKVKIYMEGHSDEKKNSLNQALDVVADIEEIYKELRIRFKDGV